MSDYNYHDYNCPDCNEAKLQSDKNARKINEVIDQVNALIQVNNETVDLIEEKVNEKVEEIAEIKVNEIFDESLDDLNTEIELQKIRIDNLTTIKEGSTTGDSELIDGRVGADGKVYNNIGNAIRSQISKVIDYKNHLNSNIILDKTYFSDASNWSISLGTGTISNGVNINITSFPFKVKTQHIDVRENTNYTLRLVYSSNNDLGVSIGFFNISGEYVSQTDFTLSKNLTSIDKSFSTPYGTAKIVIFINAYAVETITLEAYFAQGDNISELNLTEYIQNLATNIVLNSCKPLMNKTVLGIGDSLMEGVINNGGWLKILETDYGVIATNAGKSGTTMATSSVTNSIWNRINNYVENDYDYILLEGGINDYFTNVPLGIVKPSTETGYNSDSYDTTTFAGALEQLIKTCITKWTDKKIVYIIPHKYLDGSPENLSRQKQYWDIAKEICNKWGIPYIDLFNNSLLNGLIPTIRDNYFKINGGEGDKLHPNEKGYRTQIGNIVGKMLY